MFSVTRNKRNLPHSYAEAEAMLGNRSTRKVANNTTLERRALDCIALRLHWTDVVTFRSDGSIELNTGGWQTVTTRSRMRDCGVKIYTDGGITAVSWGGIAHTYQDGMILLPDGTVQGAGAVPPEEARKRRRRALRKGRAIYCESQRSSRWPNGNAPEALCANGEEA